MFVHNRADTILRGYEFDLKLYRTSYYRYEPFNSYWLPKKAKSPNITTKLIYCSPMLNWLHNVNHWQRCSKCQCGIAVSSHPTWEVRRTTYLAQFLQKNYETFNILTGSVSPCKIFADNFYPARSLACIGKTSYRQCISREIFLCFKKL